MPHGLDYRRFEVNSYHPHVQALIPLRLAVPARCHPAASGRYCRRRLAAKRHMIGIGYGARQRWNAGHCGAAVRPQACRQRGHGPVRACFRAGSVSGRRVGRGGRLIWRRGGRPGRGPFRLGYTSTDCRVRDEGLIHVKRVWLGRTRRRRRRACHLRSGLEYAVVRALRNLFHAHPGDLASASSSSTRVLYLSTGADWSGSGQLKPGAISPLGRCTSAACSILMVVTASSSMWFDSARVPLARCRRHVSYRYAASCALMTNRPRGPAPGLQTGFFWRHDDSHAGADDLPL